nr:MAG TPA: hypothetical protein [Caudoviricetes sp.]
MKTNVVNVVKMKALVKNIKRERPDLVASFSERALAEIAKNEITNYPRFVNDIGFLTVKCIASMENQLKTTHEYQKNLLQVTLECDCEYPLEVIAKMTPRQKINNYLFWNGIEGFTDDILDVISAAYGIILEPDLNR